jgi:hypothetical protein
MHRSIDVIRNRRLDQNRRSQRATLPIRFQMGDFVLIADIKRKITFAKLLAHWVGPYQIVDSLSPYVFVVQSLVNQLTRNVHASRMIWYCDSQLDVTTELIDHIAQQGLRYDVENITDHRFKSCYEVLVTWVGFSSIESTWEPLLTIFADVPARVDAYLQTLLQQVSAPLYEFLKEGSVVDPIH